MDQILLVDDDLLILQALSRILEGEGYKVVARDNPLEALKETDYVVVITDFMMPQMNGIELLSAIRKSNPRAVRVLLTAAGDFKIASEAVNRGEVYRLLGKPWAIPDLTSCVRQAVEHYHLLDENARLSAELEGKNTELTRINRNLEGIVVERTNGLLEGMISALDYRDTETQWHSRRVSLYSRRIAQEIALDGKDLDIVEQGALLHDIGKIGVRDSILLKPGPLTPDEWTEMRLHPEFGYRMLARMPYLHDASLVVLQHQERYDGHGYPQGLKGKEIVVGARVFAIADTMDAITSDRPYRKGRSQGVAKEEIQRCRSSQFDPEIVDAYLQIPDSEWAQIRATVEGLEADQIKQWGAPPPRAASRTVSYRIPGAVVTKLASGKH